MWTRLLLLLAFRRLAFRVLALGGRPRAGFGSAGLRAARGGGGHVAAKSWTVLRRKLLVDLVRGW